jgi:hypothetical protein
MIGLHHRERSTILVRTAAGLFCIRADKLPVVLLCKAAGNWKDNHMPRKARAQINERKLSKGHLRKLNALRKSLGEEIADEAFAKWIAQQTEAAPAGDRNAVKIAEAITKLATSGEIRIPRGGYVLRRGRGRVIVERPEE